MRKIVDTRDARASVKAARTAGLSLGAWARRQAIDGRSLHAWSVNLGLATTPPKPGLIELVPTTAPPVPARYVVRAADTGIEIGDDFHDETLARTLRVLRTC